MNLDLGVQLFLSERRNVYAPSTWNKYRTTLEGFAVAFGFHPPRVDEITRDHIIEWRGRSDAKPQSINKYTDRVRAFFKYAVERGWCAKNPCDGVYPLAAEAPERTQYGSGVLGQALNAARCPRDRAAIAVALELLLRGNEITALRVGDVDLDNRIVKVRVSKKHGPLTWDEMAITRQLEHELREWLRVYAEVAGELRPDDYLFPRQWEVSHGSHSQRRVEPTARMGSPYRIVKRALRAVGVTDDRLGFHTIRRSAARILFDHLSDERGDSRALSHVSSLLHHENRRTTELYLGVEGDRRARNEAVRQGSASALVLATAELDELDVAVSSEPVLTLVPAACG